MASLQDWKSYFAETQENKMAAFIVSILNVAITFLDIVLLPINFLIYRKPWIIKREPLNYQPHEFLYSRGSSEVTYKPATPEPTCQNAELMKNEKLNTMNKVFEFMVQRYGKRPCLGQRKVIGVRKHLNNEGKLLDKLLLENRYTWQSYEDVARRASNVAHGLNAIRCNQDKVLIYADTCCEWLITALACFQSSITIVTLYTNLGMDAVVHGINQVRVEIIITNQVLLEKLLSMKDKLPHLKTIIVFMDKALESKVIFLKQNSVTIIPFEHVESKGAAKAFSKTALKAPSPESEAVIMYTSGSTGEPKGVVLTHQNLTASLMACCIRACNLMGHERSPDEAYLAYLPLAHIFEITQEIIVLALGIKVGYSSPHTLTDSSTAIMPGHRGDISILRPTVMAAVPVILDRIYKSVRAKIGQKGRSFQEIFDYLVSYRSWWLKKGFDTPLLNKLLFSKIKDSFGGRLHAIIAGGAPLSANVQDFLRTALDINLAQGYGLTETNGGISLSTAEDLSLGRVGQPLPGVRIKLVDWSEGGYLVRDQDDRHGPRGEIWIGGPMIAKGYYELAKLTEENFVIDDNGSRWFKTGDIGQMSLEDAALQIIDRKKDLVKLQMGEYVSLGKVETCLKTHFLIDTVCVVADSTKSYCVCLVVPDMLKLVDFARKLEIFNLSYQDICKDSLIVDAVSSMLIGHANENQLQRFEIPRRYALIPSQWLPETGLVTAALKLKRKAVHERYKEVINELYSLSDDESKDSKLKLS